MAKPAKPKAQTGILAIRSIFKDALQALEETAPQADPDPSSPRGGIKPGQWDGAPWSAMPPECPVQILGIQGETVWAVSATGSLMGVDKWDLPTLGKLFAPYPNYMLWAWPAFAKAKTDPDTGELLPPKVARLERDKCALALITEAGRRGIFDPQERVRGRGGWADDTGAFVFHSGDFLWMVTEDAKREKMLLRAKPSEFGSYFYAKAGAILTPWQSPIGWKDSPAHEILQHFQSWNWKRPWLDPVLYLGWCATALMGGALKERPAVFLTGPRGIGKSTLHDYTKALFGGMLYSTANTTAAGIYQNIGQDSRPVAIDEFEAKARGDREQQIIELFRQSFSGAELYRGGQNHEGVRFSLRSSFQFSGILPPPMTNQDLSRMAILGLDPLPRDGRAEPVLQAHWGRMLLRQVMDGWTDFTTTLLPKWRRRLHLAGFDARGQDTYGTLLAAADLMLSEIGLIDAGFASIGDALDEEWLIDALSSAMTVELVEQSEKWEDVIDRILSSPIEGWTRGEKPTVGKVLEEFESNEINITGARERLALAGLGLKQGGEVCNDYVLMVPRSHPALARIFEGSDYRDGGWYNAIKQAPPNISLRSLSETAYTVKISKAAKYCAVVNVRAYETRRGG